MIEDSRVQDPILKLSAEIDGVQHSVPKTKIYSTGMSPYLEAIIEDGKVVGYNKRLPGLGEGEYVTTPREVIDQVTGINNKILTDLNPENHSGIKGFGSLYLAEDGTLPTIPDDWDYIVTSDFEKAFTRKFPTDHSHQVKYGRRKSHR